MNKRIRLTESDLRNIIRESVKRVVNESGFDDDSYTSWEDEGMAYRNPEQGIDESNMIMDDVGKETEPWFRKMEEFKIKYGKWLKNNLDNPHQNTFGYNFDGRFAKAFNDVYNGLYTINCIFNH